MSGRIKVSDGSSWPRPDIEADEDMGLAWRLTYTTPTHQELLAAASVISAYEHMVLGTDRQKRDLVCRDIRAALRAEITEHQPLTLDDGTNDLTVCITHGRFVPCRKDWPHCETTNPFWVKSVRDYQQSEVPDIAWEPATLRDDEDES